MKARVRRLWQRLRAGLNGIYQIHMGLSICGHEMGHVVGVILAGGIVKELRLGGGSVLWASGSLEDRDNPRPLWPPHFVLAEGWAEEGRVSSGWRIPEEQDLTLWQALLAYGGGPAATSLGIFVPFVLSHVCVDHLSPLGGLLILIYGGWLAGLNVHLLRVSLSLRHPGSDGAQLLQTWRRWRAAMKPEPQRLVIRYADYMSAMAGKKKGEGKGKAAGSGTQEVGHD